MISMLKPALRSLRIKVDYLVKVSDPRWNHVPLRIKIPAC